MKQKATFGGGCFWCTEAIFFTLKGVQNLKPGYMGGHTAQPSYEAVCNGTTGHAEVIQFEFENTLISYEDLLNIFFQTHNPTTFNQQGADTGTQYRSVIFYHNEEQLKIAKSIIENLDKSMCFDSKIVTEISPATTFYEAEPYHHEYYLNNYRQPYCQAVIQPKLAKLLGKFKHQIRKDLL